jgi:hypothetical protein
MAADGGRGGKKSVDKLEAENEFLRKGGWAEEIGKTVRTIVLASAGIAGIYLLTHAVEALAGKKTDANILVSFLANLDVSIMLSWAVGGAGVLYGRAQNKLRKTTVERLESRIRKFEAQVDPGRSSSKLTPRGETNPEDR